MQITKLHDGWTLDVGYAAPGYPRPQLKKQEPVPAQVPGCVHLDLLRAGIIPDPFLSRYELGVQWVDEADWTYRLSFEWSPSAFQNRLLRFDCLDTVAAVYLNGQEIASSDNYFLPLEIDVTSTLRNGRNDLVVRLASAVRVGSERRAAYFEEHGHPTQTTMFDERAFVRKPGYMSGWDWGPRLVGAGLSGDVSLIEYDRRMSDLEVHVVAEGDAFLVTALADQAESLAFVPGNSETTVEEIAHGRWRVQGPLWWPAGMGDQPLHEVRATLGDQVQAKMVGLRTIELRQEADQYGSSFEFIINGKRLWARGANWIPDDSFPVRIRPEETRRQVERLAALNFNMLRVWGGGLYESEAFYDACDRLGILVWQDFPFACMHYPDDGPMQEVVAREAEHHIRRLRHRASLALWCGNNENLAMFQQKWGSPDCPDRYCGEHLYDRVLPDAVARLNSNTPYIASSPIGVAPDESIPIGPLRNVGIDGFGDSHYWDVWHGRGDWVHYADSKARFSSEFGFASSCSLGQWEACLSTSERESTFPSQAVLHHEKTGKAWDVFRGMVELHYPSSTTLEDWTYFSQLNQRDALRFGIEHYRRSEFCRGSLVWQANDCWPVMSWSVQDYQRRLKPAGFELQRLYADVMISVDFVPGNPLLKVWVCNDGPAPRSDRLTAEIVDIHQGPVSSTSVPFTLAADARELVLEIQVSGYEARNYAVHLSVTGDDRWIFLAEPREMNWSPSVVTALLADGMVEVESKGFVAELVVWDPLDPDNLTDPEIGQPGWHPITGWNVKASFNSRTAPSSLRVRTLSANLLIPRSADAIIPR